MEKEQLCLIMDKRKNVFIRNIDQTCQILNEMKLGGIEQLQCVLDFDRTMSRVHRDGVELDCSWGVLENSTLMPADYTYRSLAIRAKYLPIEIDPVMSLTEKIPYMKAWYTETNELLQNVKINRDMIPQLVASSNLELRPGLEHLMNRLKQAGVPVLILSAGLGDVVEGVLRYHGLLSDNVKVVSNFMAFDEDGFVTGIKGEMVHVLNKNESSIHDTDYFQRLQSRHYVFLLGDSMGDLNMADGCNVRSILKIGFLNSDPLDKRLEEYMDGYNVVLVDDQTMDVANLFLDVILQDV